MTHHASRTGGNDLYNHINCKHNVGLFSGFIVHCTSDTGQVKFNFAWFEMTDLGLPTVYRNVSKIKPYPTNTNQAAFLKD